MAEEDPFGSGEYAEEEVVEVPVKEWEDEEEIPTESDEPEIELEEE